MGSAAAEMASASSPNTASIPGPPDYSELQFERARYRRLDSSFSESSDAGEFLVSSVKYRVGAPPPYPLPIHSSWNDQCTLVRKTLGVSLENRVSAVIANFGLGGSTKSVELVSRSVPGMANGHPTILIVAEWVQESPQTWERIVTEVKKYVDMKRLANKHLVHPDIAVEMIAEELTLDKYVSVIPCSELTPGLKRDWIHIQEKVEQILEANPATKGRMTSIALFKLGFSVRLDSNPLTVYISVNYESKETKWPPIVSQIQQCLDAYGHNLYAHLEHNTPESYPNFPLLPINLTPKEKRERIEMFNFMPDRQYDIQVGLGADLGPAKYITKDSGEEAFPGVGTLGCWVEIRTKNSPQWTKYALTNYHVLRPAIDGFRLGVHPNSGRTIPATPVNGSDLWNADLRGVHPNTNFNSAPAKIEHPTRTKHCFAVEHLRSRVEDNVNSPGPETVRLAEHLQNVIDFFDNSKQLFGTLYCASGYKRRTPHNGRLDWALIKPLDPSRVGKNILPTDLDWYHNHAFTYMPLNNAMGQALRQPPLGGLRSTFNGGPLFKLGASTGPTAGQFTEVRASVVIHDDRHILNATGENRSPFLKSEEFVYIGDPNSQYLAKHGDSGCLAFNKQGEAVGLLFRGHVAQQASNSYAFITPIEDVFADIKSFSKHTIIDIRIAVD